MATHQEMIAIDIVIAAHYLFYLFTHYKRTVPNLHQMRRDDRH